MDNLSSINNSSVTIDPDQEGSIARQKVVVHDDWMGVVRTEERSNLLRGLLWEGVGTDDVENFVRKQEGLRFYKVGKIGDMLREREHIRGHMESKLADNELDETVRRRKKDKGRSRLKKLLGKRKSNYKRFVNRMRDEANALRRTLRGENKINIRGIVIERRKEANSFKVPEVIKRYANAKIFDDDLAKEFKPGEILGPVIVGENASLLSKNEVSILARGPEF